MAHPIIVCSNSYSIRIIQQTALACITIALCVYTNTVDIHTECYSPQLARSRLR